jgi:hypothetical protein
MAAPSLEHPSVAAPPPAVQAVQLLAGFQVSQALYVLAKLDVPQRLAGGPRPVEELALETGADALSLKRLMRAAASLGVFAEPEPEVYALTPLGEALGAMRDLALTWMETHYEAFGRLLDGVKAGQPAASLHYGMPFFAWLGSQPEQVARFTGAMANLTDGIKVHALHGYTLPPGETVDVGGADGAVLARLADRGIVFDLPHVIDSARERIQARGLTPVAGDFFETVPEADVYLLSMILHDWDDAHATRLLRAIANAARPGARVVALELVVPPGNGPHMAKMIDLTMLGMLTGRERTPSEHEALFDGAGLTLDRIVTTQTPLSIVEASVRL